MQLATVVGSVWSTRKEENLIGMKLMIVKPVNLINDEPLHPFVAVDTIGAGVGDVVIVVKGSPARHASGNNQAPIDAAIVGIVDDKELEV